MTLQQPGKTWGNGWLLQVDQLGEFVHPERDWQMIERLERNGGERLSRNQSMLVFFPVSTDVYCGVCYIRYHLKIT